MRRTPRLFPSGQDPRERRAHRAVATFFLLLFVALVWPVYPHFSGIRPLVLGMPFSLYYVVVLLVAGFLVLLGLFLWEGRRADRSADAPDARGRPHTARERSPHGREEP